MLEQVKEFLKQKSNNNKMIKMYRELFWKVKVEENDQNVPRELFWNFENYNPRYHCTVQSFFWDQSMQFTLENSFLNTSKKLFFHV